MTLQLYRERLALIKKQRDALDEDMAQVLAEGMQDGHKIFDMLMTDKPTSEQKAFDL